MGDRLFPAGTVFTVLRVDLPEKEYGFSTGWEVQAHVPKQTEKRAAGPFRQSTEAEDAAQQLRKQVVKDA